MNHDDRSQLSDFPALPTRRQVVVTALGTGFALAVRPVTAATITTDTTGLDTSEIKIPTTSGEIPAYRAAPAKGKSFPMILVVQEIFGVHEHIKDVCRRLAKRGYLAIAPELYARQGDVSKLADFKDIMKVVATVPDAQVMTDLDATVAWVKKEGAGNPSKLGITGFCWGGRIVWLYGAHSPALKAGVAWYGRLVGERTPLQPTYPVDVAGSLEAPILGLYGGADQAIPPAAIDQMRQALAGASKASKGAAGSEIHV